MSPSEVHDTVSLVMSISQAVLVMYIVNTDTGTHTFDITELSSMVACEKVIEVMDSQTKEWGRGQGDDRTTLRNRYSVNCIQLEDETPNIVPSTTTTPAKILPPLIDDGSRYTFGWPND